MQRDIKFDLIYKGETRFHHKKYHLSELMCGISKICDIHHMMDLVATRQYTGLKDKNGAGLIELYEGDIISRDGKLIGNIYEDNKRKTDLIIPKLGTKAWEAAYKEAVARGFDYSE